MKHLVRILSCACVGLLFSLVVNAQEPAELGDYQITKIGSAQTTFQTGQWYLLGRNPYLVSQGQADGYVYDSNTAPVDMKARVANAACTSTDNWTCTGSNTFHYNTWSTENGMSANFLEYWVGSPTNLSDATIRHSQVTGLTSGYYSVSVEAVACSEANNSPVSGATFWATGTSNETVDIATGTAGAGAFTGWHGTYTLIVKVGDAGTLDFGFTIANANFNWFAFKEVTLSYLGNPYEDKTSEVANAACNQGTNSTLTSWSKTGAGTLSRQNNNARFNLGDAWTGYAGDLWNSGSVFGEATTVSHSQITGLPNGRYQISVDARAAGTEPTPVVNPTVAPVEFKYYYQSAIGSTYETDNNPDVKINIATSDILASIGAATTDDINVYAEEPNGTRWAAAENGDVLGNTDGWRNRQGYFSLWGESTTAYCIKLNYKAANNQVFYIGGHHNAGVTATACVYTARFIYQNKTTQAEVPVVVNLNYGTSFSYEVETSIGSVQGINYYQGSIVEVTDIAAIRTAIGAASDADYTVYANDGTSTVRGTTDGWRDANGEFQTHGDAAYFYVQNDGENKTRYIVGGILAHSNEVGSYTTRLLYKHNTTGATAAVYITLKYTAEFRYSAETQTGNVEGVNYYQATPVTVTDIETIRTALLAPSLDDITVYSEEPDGTRVLGVRKDTNGWRDASGAFHAWGDTDSYFYLQETDKQNYVMGGYPDHSNAPGSYTAKLIYRNNSNGKEIPVYFTLTYYAVPTFYANGQKVKFTEGTKYEGTGYVGYRGSYTLDVVVTDGNLDFGFSLPQGYWKWLSFKNVELLYLGGQGLTMSNNEKPAVGSNAGSDDVKKYLFRFVYDGEGIGGSYWQLQVGNGNYADAPSADGTTVQTSAAPGKYFAYLGEGYRSEEWTVADGVFLKNSTTGAAYNYYLADQGVGQMLLAHANANDNERWGVDIDAGGVFALYPVTLCEANPDVPSVALPDVSTKTSPKFYKLKSKATHDYATYTDVAGAYFIMGCASPTGNSYWWFTESDEETKLNEGTKEVRIHNVLQTDITYGNTLDRCENLTIESPVKGVTETGSVYYLLPTTVNTTTGFAISRTQYSRERDSWMCIDETLPELGQDSHLEWQEWYGANENTLWEYELVDISTVWTDVLSTLRESLHAGSYFSPSEGDVETLFSSYATTPTAATFFSKLEELTKKVYDMCTDSNLPTLAPETGGRFYFKNYAVPTHYFAFGTDPDATDSDGECLRIKKVDATHPLAPEHIWELMPFSDPTLIVRVDDQPRDNSSFNSWYYAYELPHRPLQRFWLRNRSKGNFLTHEPVDKSSYTKINEGVWNMNEGGTPAFANWRGNNEELGTVNSLNREDADLWYLDVVTNPRTGVRTGVLRTLFCYDYAPWEGCTSSDGREGDAIAGYNYPVVRWDLGRKRGNAAHPLHAAGVTFTDPSKAFSQWVIYKIDTDLPEAGVNYTFKNKYAKKYAYWEGTSDGGSLKLTESVENLATAEDELNNNRGVWTLLNLATPVDGQYRIANRWAIQNSESNQNLLSGSPYKMSSTGSTFVLPTSNVDSEGLAIGTSVMLNFNSGSWMNGNVGVTVGKSEDDKAVWGIDKVDRLYDDVIYDLNKMLGNLHGGDSYFYVDKDAVSEYQAQVTKWSAYSGGNRDDINENNEYPTYKTIKDLVNGKIGDNKFVMPVKKDADIKRYLIRNKETGRYLADMGYLTTVDSTDVNHYAIWDLSLEETESGTKYLYRLTNEGAANEMDAQGDSRKTENPRDYKYLKWDKDAGESAFQMAKSETTYTKLHFRPDGEGYARLHWYKAGDTDLDDDPVLYGPTWGDRVVKSRVLRNNNVYWEVIPVADFLTDERSVDYLKTEKALVQHSINELEGYSGGPISLTDVNSTVVGKGTGEYDLKNLPGAVSGTAGSIASLGTIIRYMWKMDDMFLLQWKPGFPLYVENVFRPSRNARLTAGTGEEAWTTTETKNDDEASQTFEFETATDGKVYLWNKSETKYVKASTADDEAVASTTTDADKAQLTVKEILPSMYSMMDQEGRYLSIDDDGNVEWTALCGYGSLWRIKCNDYLQPNIAQVPSASTLWPSEFVNTFYSDYDTRIDKTTGVRAYYAKNSDNGGLSIGERGDEKQIQILFNEAKNDDGHYYLQGGQPYMLVKTGGKVSNDELKVWSQHKGEYERGTLSGKNLLSLLAADTEIDDTNQRNIFELNYIAPGTVIGQIVGHEVTAFGIGFYPVRKGRTLAKGTVVINSEMLGNWVKELRKAYTSSSSVKGEAWAPSLQIILEDEDGTTTALDELMAAEEMTDGPVYDLSGRKVSDSFRDVTRKGMYIVNGQKVMKK